MQFLTSKVYLYITTVQSESLACKIGVLHIYNRYTIIYYHNKTKANKKQENNFLNTLSFLQFSQHFYKTRKTDSHYYYRRHRHLHHHCQDLLFYRTPVSTKGLFTMCLKWKDTHLILGDFFLVFFFFRLIHQSGLRFLYLIP